MSKLILAIESSCDETACAISRDGREILADVIYSQADMHALYGGVVPEIASRKHIEKVSLVAEQAVKQAGIKLTDIDAVAATCAPGLIGALLVGANFAKATALALNVPFVPVHHIRGHVAANYIAFPELQPPMTALVASGGHTVILDVADYTHMEVVGASRDDAAGEAFDKIGRVLGLPYPGGAALDRLSKQGDAAKYPLPPAIIKDHPYDFSFSGLKTAAVNLIHNAQQKGEDLPVSDLAASFSAAVSEELVPRTMFAARQKGYGKVAVVGGVAANSRIRRDLEAACQKDGCKLYMPPLKLCGDNGSMIGSQGYYEYLAGARAGTDLNAFANRDISLQY
jgi:N6-L-threonylcarbamoyladenine synthase